MRKIVVEALLCAAGVALLGCATLLGPKPTVFVPVVERKSPEWRMPSPREGPQPDRTQAKIRIEVRLFTWPAAQVAELGFGPDNPAPVASSEAKERILKRARTAPGDFQYAYYGPCFRLPLTIPFTAYSKEKANLQCLINHNFIADVEMWKVVPGENRQGSGEIDTVRGPGGVLRVDGGSVPTIGNIPEGFVMDLQAEAEGSDVVVRAIQVQLMKLLELYDCGGVPIEFEVQGGIGRVAMHWQEPIVLVAKSQLPEPCFIRLKPGEAVVVPIQGDSLVVGRAKLRDLFREVLPRLPVDPVARFLGKLDARGYPAETNRRHFMLLSARILKEGEEAPKPESK